MKKPALSVVIPTLNEEKYIGHLLKALEEQTFQNFEVIVVDGNSKDKTQDIVKSFKKLNIKLVVEKKKGIGLARNSGAKKASGDILLFLDADVLMRKSFLKNCLNEFESRFLEVSTARSEPMSHDFKDYMYHVIQSGVIRAAQYFSPLAAGYCIFCTRRLHERIGGFDEQVPLGEDVDYVERAGQLGKFRVMRSSKILVSVRRFKKEGWTNAWSKYMGAGLYRIFKGNVKSDIFKYDFGKYEKHG